MISRKATNTNFTLFGLTRPELEHMSYHTLGEHANHYTTDMVETHQFFWDKKCTCETHMFLVMTNQNVILQGHLVNSAETYFLFVSNRSIKFNKFFESHKIMEQNKLINGLKTNMQ
jgi:hypothetical protein